MVLWGPVACIGARSQSRDGVLVVGREGLRVLTPSHPHMSALYQRPYIIETIHSYTLAM